MFIYSNSRISNWTYYPLINKFMCTMKKKTYQVPIAFNSQTKENIDIPSMEGGESIWGGKYNCQLCKQGRQIAGHRLPFPTWNL
jgi:hypothetical protein